MLLIIGILLLAVVAAGIFLYNTIFQPFSLPETAYIHIDREKNYEEVVRQLKEEAGLPSEKDIPAAGRPDELSPHGKNREICH